MGITEALPEKPKPRQTMFDELLKSRLFTPDKIIVLPNSSLQN
jgi:hypothetical protein